MEFAPRRNTGNTSANTAFVREIYQRFIEEFNTVAEYTAIAIAASDRYPAVAKLFDELARVELAHHTRLGQILRRLGVERALQWRGSQGGGRRQASPFASEAATAALFEAKIAGEMEDAATYRRLMRDANDMRIAAILQEIATEEEGHATALAAMQARLGRS